MNKYAEFPEQVTILQNDLKGYLEHLTQSKVDADHFIDSDYDRATIYFHCTAFDVSFLLHGWEVRDIVKCERARESYFAYARRFILIERPDLNW